MPFRKNINYAPVRAAALALRCQNADITRDDEAQSITIEGRYLPESLHLEEGVNYAHLRNYAAFLKAEVKWNPSERWVNLVK